MPARVEETVDRRLLELRFLEKIVGASAATRDHHRLLRIIVDETTEATDEDRNACEDIVADLDLAERGATSLERLLASD